MKRAFTLLELVIVVALLAVIAAFLWPVFYRPKPDRRDQFCQSNLKQIGLGFMQYTQDYNEKFPPSHATASVGWADSLQPYLKSRQLFSCPKTQKSSPLSSDYFYNRNLVRVASDRIDEPANTIATGDGNDDAPPWSSWSQLPADAATNSTSPAQRHLGRANSNIGGANYGFADGHVKWFTPENIAARAVWKPRLF